MGDANANQYPHIRALTVCLRCGQAKNVGLLLCWPCHNELKMIHDGGYGPMDRVIQVCDGLLRRMPSRDHDLVIKPDGTGQ